MRYFFFYDEGIDQRVGVGWGASAVGAGAPPVHQLTPAASPKFHHLQ
ncbi:MAG: hypothetical protein N3E49_03615 [Bacteroidia bacterium]|nr:hypothetical protein [Bacteroidia bacterium]